MLKKALLVTLEAKPGKEQDVIDFLNGGLGLVQEEPMTVTWYAIQMGSSTFGIFDTFAGDEGRDAHLTGKVAEALMAHADILFSTPPDIKKVDLLAVK